MNFRKALPVSFALVSGSLLLGPLAGAGPNAEVLRGWLSDELCARGRAEEGAFTATNRDCAQECVRGGKKIVFIDPTGKRVLEIVNQSAARGNVGDYVEISGEIDANGRLRADSIKFLEKASPMCEAPARKGAKKN
jgi:hypothetical protein